MTDSIMSQNIDFSSWITLYLNASQSDPAQMQML